MLGRSETRRDSGRIRKDVAADDDVLRETRETIGDDPDCSRHPGELTFLRLPCARWSVAA